MFTIRIIIKIEEWLKEHVPIGFAHILSTIWSIIICFVFIDIFLSDQILDIVYYNRDYPTNYDTVKSILTWSLTVTATLTWLIWYFAKLRKVTARTTPENYEDEAYDIVFIMNAFFSGLLLTSGLFVVIYSKLPFNTITVFLIIELLVLIPLYCFVANRRINKKISEIYVPEPSAYPEDFADEQIFRD